MAKTKAKVESYDEAFARFYALDDQPLLWAAQADMKAVKQASAAGQPIPRTPAKDAFDRRYEEGTTLSTRTTKKTTSGGGVKMRDVLRFTHNGMPIHESHMLGGVAFHFTEGLGKKGDERKLDSEGLTALLHKLGVKDIAKPGWEVELPNGHRIGTIRVDQVDEYRRKAQAAKKAASNGNKPAAKRTTKATGKRATKKVDTPKKVPTERPLTQGQKAMREGRAARAAKKATPAKTAAPAKKATTASARAKAGVRPIPKKTAGKATKRTARK